MEKETNNTDLATPAFFRIDENEVDATFDFGSFVLTRAAAYMCYDSKGGYHVFVEATNESTYQRLSVLLDYAIEQDAKKKKGELSAEDEDNLYELADYISVLLFTPAFVLTSDDLMFKQFTFLNEEMEKLLEASTQELQEQDFDKNSEFKTNMLVFDAIGKELANSPDIEEDDLS